MTRDRTKQIVRAGSETIFRFANPNGFERAYRRERVRYLGGSKNMIYEGEWTERVTSAHDVERQSTSKSAVGSFRNLAEGDSEGRAA
jgi:hypothetical protein